MIDVERALLTKIVRESGIKDVVKAHVTKKFFFDLDNREVFVWLVQQYTKHGVSPTMGILQDEFPSFKPLKSKNPVSILVAKLKSKKLYLDLQAELRKIAMAGRDDPQEGLDLLRKAAMSLSTTHAGSEDLDATKDTEGPQSRYEEAKSNPDGVLGLTWPWPRLTKATKGMRPGDFMAIYSGAGAYKTWILLVVALHVHKVLGLPVIFLTYEMTKEDIQYRHAALLAGADWERFQEGKLWWRSKMTQRYI
jgi:replicative DNA helicase